VSICQPVVLFVIGVEISDNISGKLTVIGFPLLVCFANILPLHFRISQMLRRPVVSVQIQNAFFRYIWQVIKPQVFYGAIRSCPIISLKLKFQEPPVPSINIRIFFGNLLRSKHHAKVVNILVDWFGHAQNKIRLHNPDSDVLISLSVCDIPV